MSYYIGVILPEFSEDELERLNGKLDMHLQREDVLSLLHILDKGECFYSCFLSGLGAENGFGSYEFCRTIEETKNNLRDKPQSFKDFFFREVYPLLEERRKDAEQWVEAIRFFFDCYSMRRMGIVMYWSSNDELESDLANLSFDETGLQKIDCETIMKFRPDIVHFINRD